MAVDKCEVTRCGLCRFFSHEGRRGGSCNRLNVDVSAQWTACSLAVSPFTAEPKTLVGIANWTPIVPAERAASPRSGQRVSSRPVTVAASSTAV